MRILDGKALAATIRAEIKAKIEKATIIPALAVVIVGDDPASKIYVRNKVKACADVGMRSLVFELPADSSQQEVEDALQKLAPERLGCGVRNGQNSYGKGRGWVL